MKVMTVLGTRPEIIRLSRIIEKIDRLADPHVLVHTGQNYEPNLSDLFFEQLKIRKPDHYLGARGETFGEQIGQIFALSERVMIQEKPDLLLVLGDTNSALSLRAIQFMKSSNIIAKKSRSRRCSRAEGSNRESIFSSRCIVPRTLTL